MKKLLILLTVICLCACSNDDFNAVVEYELSSVMWAKEDGDYEELIETVLPEEVVENKGDTTMLFVASVGDYEETSSFFSNDKKAFPQLKGGAQSVVLPVYEELSTEYMNSFSGRPVPYQEGLVIIPSFACTSATHTIHPNTKVVHKRKLVFKKVTLSYKATFVEKNTNQRLIVEGKWEGKLNIASHSVVEDME